MAATIEDIVIEQGATFEKVATVKDASGTVVNLTGFLGRGQIRDKIGGSLIASFTVTITDAVNGEVTISMLPSTSASLSWDGCYVYDIEVYSGVAVVYRILQGRVKLSKEVTV